MAGPRDWTPQEPSGRLHPSDPSWQQYMAAQHGTSYDERSWRPTAPRRSRSSAGSARLVALASLLAGVAALAIAVSPLLSEARESGHGFALSTVGVTAILLGWSALRRTRVARTTGTLVMSVGGLGAGAIGTVAMLGMFATSSAPIGPGTMDRTVPFGSLQQPAQVSFSSTSIVGTAGSAAVVGNGGSVRVESGWSVRSTGEAPSATVQLERRLSGGDWRPTGVAAGIVEGAPLTVMTPPYSTEVATESVEYRFASPSAASQPVSVVYENQSRYVGMAATIYRYAAQYCPTTAVHVASLGGREAGDYGTGGRLIRVDDRVGVSANMTPESQRSLAIHECSHELQWMNYGSTHEGYEQMTAAASALFADGANGAPGLEHAADCGAMAVEPNGYLGYGGACTADELAAATRLLGGQRY